MASDLHVEDVGDVHFIVAPGDPCAINAAAVWHEDVSSQLQAHGAAVQTAATTAMSQWSGDAAAAYGTLSSMVKQSFDDGHTRACDTAATLRGISRELDHYQQVGKQAMRDAQHWIEQAKQAHARATALVPQVHAAQMTLASDLNPLNAGPFSTYKTAGEAQAAAGAAQTQLHQLSAQLRKAQLDLEHANREIERCDRRGEQAWLDAEGVVGRFSTLPLGKIAAPPMPGIPVYDVALPHGPSTYQKVLGIVQEASSDVAAASGVAAAFTFWVPGVGEVTGSIAGGASAVSAGTAWLQYEDHSGTLTDALVDTAGAATGGAAAKLDHDGEALEDGAKDLSGSEKRVTEGRATVRHAVAGQMSGVGGTFTGGTQLDKHLGDHAKGGD